MQRVDPRKLREPACHERVRVTRAKGVDDLEESTLQNGLLSATNLTVMLPEEGFSRDRFLKGEEPEFYTIVDGCHRMQAIQRHLRRHILVQVAIFEWLTRLEYFELAACTYLHIANLCRSQPCNHQYVGIQS